MAHSVLAQRRARQRAAERSDEPAWRIQRVGRAGAAGPAIDVPDALHAEARPWNDLTGAAELVRFAFEGGECGGLFDELIGAAPLAPSGFRPSAFASQVFLDELAAACFRIDIDGQNYALHDGLLMRVLGAPPRDIADVSARQAVFRELAELPSQRHDLERLYVALRRLRRALEAGPAEEADRIQRKIDVLSALKTTVEALATGFVDASSLLRRLHDAGVAIGERPAFRKLADVLDLEGHLATVEVRLRLGANGRIRAFDVLAMRENRDNALRPSPIVRFIRRLIGLFRGYRYSEHEVVVRLLDSVFAPLVEDIVRCLAMTGAVELYLAGLAFRDLAATKDLAVCLPEVVSPGASSDPRRATDAPAAVEKPAAVEEPVGVEGPSAVEEPAAVELTDLFNPLLLLQDITPRPCSIRLDAANSLVIVTGPNSGGKTRLLQGIAICQLFAQAGLFVPARRARVTMAPSMFVSIITEPDATQPEGHLGTELLRIRRLFEELEPGSLVVIDELCAGTNPLEGETIFEMVIELLPKLSPLVFISTHFLGLAQRLERKPPVAELTFLRVGLDVEEQPTYQFLPGVADTSLAHKVAERLGVTRGELERLIASKAD